MTTIQPGTRFPEEIVLLLDRLQVRYELFDGQLVVSPSATFGHERLSGLVRAQLVYQCPPELAVLGPDYNVVYAPPEPWFVCPDAMVARVDDCGDADISVAPLMVLETLSPSSRRGDTGAKWDVYRALGVASYWLIDPDAPSLTVLELHDGNYVETLPWCSAPRELYAAGGVASYWLLDPHGPRLRVLTLVDGTYVEEQRLEGPGELMITLPFPATVRLG